MSPFLGLLNFALVDHLFLVNWSLLLNTVLLFLFLLYITNYFFNLFDLKLNRFDKWYDTKTYIYVYMCPFCFKLSYLDYIHLYSGNFNFWSKTKLIRQLIRDTRIHNTCVSILFLIKLHGLVMIRVSSGNFSV